jgi:hypothetical protein
LPHDTYHVSYYVFLYRFIIFLSLVEYKDVFCLLLYLQPPEQCLGYRTHSITIEWMNEWLCSKHLATDLLQLHTMKCGTGRRMNHWCSKFSPLTSFFKYNTYQLYTYLWGTVCEVSIHVHTQNMVIRSG